jgi:AraC family transcriptional regulator
MLEGFLQKNGVPRVCAQVQTANGLSFQILKCPFGIVEVPESEGVTVDVHLGPPAKMACRRGGKRFIGTSLRGDMGVIPARTAMHWEMFDDNDLALVLSVPQKLIADVANDLGADPARIEVLDRYQIRDSQLEMLTVAVKNELESGCSSGRLYLDGLGIAIAFRLLTHHSSHSLAPHHNGQQSVSDRRLKQVLLFIEENLAQDLALEQLAAVAQVSPSHFKAVFRKSMGVPVHQYVIERRVELAKSLLLEENLSLAEIALAAGFAHQSHLARHMRRVLGAPPQALRRLLSETAGRR